MGYALGILAVPLVEIAIFVLVGGWIGLLPTLALVLLAAILGVFILRSEGAIALSQMQLALSAGENPMSPMAHGALVVLGGFLLVVPGFLTDVLGLALLLAPVRQAILTRLGPAISGRRGPGPGFRPGYRTDGQMVIDGEFEVDDPPARGGPSGWQTRFPPDAG